MYGWGRGEHGRLGFGDNDKSSKMVPQRVNLLAGEDIVQVLHLAFLVKQVFSTFYLNFSIFLAWLDLGEYKRYTYKLKDVMMNIIWALMDELHFL